MPNKQSSVAEALILVAADTMALFLKTWNYHWNVKGPGFGALHDMFGDQYAELYAAADQIAERVRALRADVPTDTPDASEDIGRGKIQSWEGMVKDLTTGHESTMETILDAIKVAEEANDQASLNLLAARQEAHEKHAWMLRATLGEK